MFKFRSKQLNGTSLTSATDSKLMNVQEHTFWKRLFNRGYLFLTPLAVAYFILKIVVVIFLDTWGVFYQTMG